jgi:diaminohydroxyphosphoribosylaminopyrimidine deaminase/5-amino-6-(5-phosphoribosylamino)uracil reductase
MSQIIHQSVNIANEAKSEDFMRYALQIAERGLGVCAPNPSVGCVIVKNGVVIAAEHTAPTGRPHAETQAINNATESVEGADVYVTLEPCSHHGVTAPCAEALIRAGVRKVYIAQIDHDQRVAGRGAKMLADAHIDVEVGVCYEEAQEINRGFFSRISRHRPFVTVKIATDCEGRYALAKNGAPQWVSGEFSRKFVHMLRAKSDAIITSSGTATADNPQLTCRLKGLEDDSPQRVLVDRNLTTPLHHELFKNPPLWVFSQKSSHENPLLGVKYFHNENPSLEWMLKELAHEGKNNVLVEAGPKFVAAMLEKGLVDELIWIKSPKKLGKKAPEFLSIDALQNFTQVGSRKLGEDEAVILRVR